jgi:hypothetical protein
MKPLFIPLKAEFYEAFATGSKDTEYRLYGARWNEHTCAIGRAVVLSYGYGVQRRMSGVVVGFTRSRQVMASEAWLKCYGEKLGEAACIQIKITR